LTTLRSEKNVDVAWVEFRTLLEDIGFKVEDVNRSTRKLFVSYKEEEEGFWSSLWSDEPEVSLDLPAGKYVVRVTSEQTQCAITFYDGNEQLMPESTYDKIIGPLSEVAKKLALEL